MLWNRVNLVFDLAGIVGFLVFLAVGWRRAYRNRYEFLKKRDRLQRLYSSDDKKAS
jgi:hypothetical protein